MIIANDKRLKRPFRHDPNAFFTISEFKIFDCRDITFGAFNN